MGCPKATVTITQRTKGKPNLIDLLHSNFCIPYQTGTGKVHSTLRRTLEQRVHGPRNTDDIWVMFLVGSVCHYKFLVFCNTPMAIQNANIKEKKLAAESLKTFIYEHWELGRGQRAKGRGHCGHVKI